MLVYQRVCLVRAYPPVLIDGWKTPGISQPFSQPILQAVAVAEAEQKPILGRGPWDPMGS